VTRDGISYQVDGHVARVTIDRPAVLNALDQAATRELDRVWRDIEASEQVRVVVLTGAGERAFCVGADMRVTDAGKTGLDYWADTSPDGFGALALRETLDVPVIARVNGYALGGGLEMALGCDILVAAESAQLGLTEARLGRIPLDGGAVTLPRRLPYHVAMGMLLTGRKISAAQAHRWGLVNEVVPAGDLDAAVDRWVSDVLACAPLSLRAIKNMVRQSARLTPRQAQALRTPPLVAALRSSDAIEGQRAFLDKRAPQWSGK
jgi:crotonobetainyl-CoA hydratase